MFALTVAIISVITVSVDAVKYTILETPCLFSEYHAACQSANLLPALINDIPQAYEKLHESANSRVWIDGYQKHGQPVHKRDHLTIIIDDTVKDRKHLSVDLIDTDQDTTVLRPMCMDVEGNFGSWRGNIIRSKSDERIREDDGTAGKNKKKKRKMPVAVEESSTTVVPASDDSSTTTSTTKLPTMKPKKKAAKKSGHVRRRSVPTEEMRIVKLSDLKEKEPKRKKSDQTDDTTTGGTRVTMSKGRKRKESKKAKNKTDLSEMSVSAPFNVANVSDIPFETVDNVNQ